MTTLFKSILRSHKSDISNSLRIISIRINIIKVNIIKIYIKNTLSSLENVTLSESSWKKEYIIICK